jgi:SAM-dependent methyltransferase
MSELSPSREGLLRRIYHRIPAPPSTNYCVAGYDHPDPFAGLSSDALIYDVGSKDVREYGRWKLPVGARVKRIDIDPAAQPDIVADAHNLHMIPDSSADCVVSVCVLEHCERPHAVIAEFFRILKPGGRLFVGIPFMFPYHADPFDHWRVSYTGVDHLCRQFHKTGSGFNRGPASCMAHFNVVFLALLFSFNSLVLYGILFDVFKWLFFWVKYLDWWLIRHPVRHAIHAGVWFLGTKPQSY